MSKIKLNSNAGGSLSIKAPDGLTMDSVVTAMGLDDNVSSTTSTYSSSKIDSMITRGSSANGIWTKFADGTLICYGTTRYLQANGLTNGGVKYSAGEVVTFPMAFISIPTITISTTEYGAVFAWGGITKDTSATGCRVRIAAMDAAATASIHWQAIGRWK